MANSSLWGHTHNYTKSEFSQKFCSRCHAYCCRVECYVPLLKEELGKIVKLSRELQCDVVLSIERFGNQEQVWIMSHTRGPCGFLDQQTNICRIYKDRPSLCQEYFCDPQARFSFDFIAMLRKLGFPERL